MALPTSPKLKHVFISYKHNHKPTEQCWAEFQSLVLDTIRNKNNANSFDFTIFIDEMLTGGDDWKKTIRENLLFCDILVAFVSQPYLNSDFVIGKEVNEVLKREKVGEKVYIYPIIVSPVNMASLPMWLSNREYRPKGLNTAREMLTVSHLKGHNRTQFWTNVITDDFRTRLKS